MNTKKGGSCACERRGVAGTKPGLEASEQSGHETEEGHKGLTGEVTDGRSLISMAVFSQRVVSFTS